MQRLLVVSITIGIVLLFALKEILEHYFDAQGETFTPPSIFIGAALTSFIFFVGLRIGVRGGLPKVSITDQLLSRVVDFDNLLQERERELNLRAQKLTEQQQSLVELARNDVIADGDLGRSLQEVAQITARTLDVDRCSIWILKDKNAVLSCLERYETKDRFHDTGHAVNIAACPDYPANLDKKRLLGIPDVAESSDPFRTCIQKQYGWAHKAFIDVPIRQAGKIAGVICFDDTLTKRHWSTDEEHFATSAADLVAVLLERTSRHKAEQALRESERRYAAVIEDKLKQTDARYKVLIEMAPIGIALVDQAGQIIFSNTAAERLLGTGRATVSENGRPETTIAKAIHARKPLEHEEVSLTTEDGRRRHVSLSLVPLHDEKGEFDGSLIFAIDLTPMKAIDHALQESEKRFRQFADHADEILWMASGDLRRVLYLSPAFETIFKMKISEIEQSPMSFLARIHAQDQSKIQQIVEDRAEGPKTTEFRIIWPDGEVRWLYSRSFPVLNERNEVSHYAGITRDITARKTAEEALKENEERFRQVTENIEDVFWMTDLPKNRIIYVSPAYETIWGRTCESLYKNPTSFLEAIHPDDRLRVMQALKKQTLGHSVDQYDEEYRVVRPDGSIRWVRDRAFPVASTTGEIYRVTGIAVDITKTRESERDLMLLANIVSMSVDAISTGRSDGIVTSWNKAAEAIFGFKAEEIVGKDVRDLFVPPERSDEAALTLQKNVKAVVRMRTERLHKDGRRIPVMMTTFPLIDEKGAVYGRAGIHTDLTNLVEMEKKLVEQSRMAAIGAMAAGVAHEIRNPLFGISTVAQILVRETTENPKLAELGDSMLAEIDRLNRMLRNLLLYSRPLRIEVTEFSPRDLIEELLKFHQEILREKEMTCQVSSIPEETQVRVDRDKVRQVILNLLLNAIEASPSGATLIISSEVEENRTWTFKIHNNGDPIPSENLSAVFEPFFSTKAEGNGLGLSVCRKLVEDHGGTIWCESNPTAGTTFFFRIPERLDA